MMFLVPKLGGRSAGRISCNYGPSDGFHELFDTVERVSNFGCSVQVVTTAVCRWLRL